MDVRRVPGKLRTMETMTWDATDYLHATPFIDSPIRRSKPLQKRHLGMRKR